MGRAGVEGSPIKYQENYPLYLSSVWGLPRLFESINEPRTGSSAPDWRIAAKRHQAEAKPDLASIHNAPPEDRPNEITVDTEL